MDVVVGMDVVTATPWRSGSGPRPASRRQAAHQRGTQIPRRHPHVTTRSPPSRRCRSSFDGLGVPGRRRVPVEPAPDRPPAEQVMREPGWVTPRCDAGSRGKPTTTTPGRRHRRSAGPTHTRQRLAHRRAHPPGRSPGTGRGPGRPGPVVGPRGHPGRRRLSATIAGPMRTGAGGAGATVGCVPSLAATTRLRRGRQASDPQLRRPRLLPRRQRGRVPGATRRPGHERQPDGPLSLVPRGGRRLPG